MKFRPLVLAAVAVLTACGGGAGAPEPVSGNVAIYATPHQPGHAPHDRRRLRPSRDPRQPGRLARDGDRRRGLNHRMADRWYPGNAASDRCPQPIVHRAGPELGRNSVIRGNRPERGHHRHRFRAGRDLGRRPEPKRRHPPRRLLSKTRLGLRSRPSSGGGTDHR